MTPEDEAKICAMIEADKGLPAGTHYIVHRRVWKHV